MIKTERQNDKHVFLLKILSILSASIFGMEILIYSREKQTVLPCYRKRCHGFEKPDARLYTAQSPHCYSTSSMFQYLPNDTMLLLFQ